MYSSSLLTVHLQSKLLMFERGFVLVCVSVRYSRLILDVSCSVKSIRPTGQLGLEREIERIPSSENLIQDDKNPNLGAITLYAYL